MEPRSAETGPPPLRVIVYGGDVAALETALALRSFCGLRCAVTLVTPVRDLPVRTHAAGAAPAEGRPARFDLGTLASEHGLEFRSDAIVAVDDEAREARTITGARLAYDAMVIAFGARPRGAVPGASTCWGTGDAAALDSLLVDVREGATRRIAFAIPSGIRWTLPTYELALTTARRLRDEGLEAALTVATYEARAVELLGAGAEAAIAERLAKAGIELVAGREPVAFGADGLALRPQGTVAADRAISMPVVEGPRIGGLPRDAEGFLPVDAFGRVAGTERVWAAGEVTSFPVRQSGIAAQQAHVVAASIAAAAGVDVEPAAFRPVLRGLLRSPRMNGAGGRPPSGMATLWWPPEQLAGRHVSAHLGEKLGLSAPSGEDAIEVDVELGPDGRRIAATSA